MALLFFLSGALGLVYEVLWMRRFALLFGGTVVAATATLSGFFLGVAAGSALFGGRARGWRRPLLAFGLLEGGVGLGAWAALPLFALLRALPLGFDPHAPGRVALETLLAMLVVGLPALCMGGTLPALAEAAARPGRGLGLPVGRLYAINLAGAVAGTLAVPFAALPALGANGSYAAAIGGSLAVAAVAAWRGTRGDGRVPSPEPARPTAPVAGGLLGLAALSGAGTLGLQVLFTRMFALVHTSSLQAFAVVLVVFLMGLSGGAALACAGLRRGLPPRRMLGLAWWLGGGLVAAAPRLFHAATHGLRSLSATGGASPFAELLGLAALTALPAALALGVALPLLFELGGEGEGEPGPVTGRLLMANTLGAILGPLLVTFAVAPRLGLWNALLALGSLLAAAGSLQLAGRSRAVGLGLAAAVLVSVAPRGLPPVAVDATRGERIVSLREGSAGTTAVLETDRDRWITVNNAYVLGGTGSAIEERWQGHLPLLLHAAPKRVAFVGLGTGITAAAALDHPFEALLAVEIVPEVVEAARRDFATWNRGLFEDPRVRVAVGDGRQVLERGGPFDVVVGDLFVPWRPGEAPLYTREHFAAVRRALAPGGVFCQWLPLYQLSEPQLAIAVRTFADVFPRATLWRGNFLPDLATLALVGRQDGGGFQAEQVDARLRALQPGPAEPLLHHPAGLWLHLVGPVAADAAWLSSAPLNTDAHPRLELLGPRDLDLRGHFARSTLASLYGDPLHEPKQGTPLAGLDAEHRRWWAAGRALTRATAAPPDEAPVRVLEVLRGLPAELRRALEVPE